MCMHNITSLSHYVQTHTLTSKAKYSTLTFDSPEVKPLEFVTSKIPEKSQCTTRQVFEIVNINNIKITINYRKRL